MRKEEKPEKNETAVKRGTEAKLQTTVVDIDSVRDNEVKEENLGLLEAAEQDGKWNLKGTFGKLEGWD